MWMLFAAAALRREAFQRQAAQEVTEVFLIDHEVSASPFET